MTDLIFIRHGETDWNRAHRFQGQADPPLNATGHAQALRLAERLAGEPATDLWCSDLTRARQTAQPLAERWGVVPRLHPGLREQGFGIVEGMTGEAIRHRFADLWPGWLEQSADFAFPDGESLRRFSARVLATVDEIAATPGAPRRVVVTHGGVLDMLWRAAHGEPPQGLRRCEIPNTGLNHLRWTPQGLQLIGWADVAHLAALPAQPHTDPRT